MSTVYFLPVEVRRIDDKKSLLYRYERLLEKLITKDMVEGKNVALKLHLGGHYGYTHVHPAFVTRVVNRVKDCGGRPFVTDHRRDNRIAGVVPEAFGCPIYHATGLDDKYAYPVKTGFRPMPKVDVAGYLHDADVLININHAKGHGTCGFGAAIKNLGMGAVTGHYRGVIHRLMDKAFRWNAKKCIHCGKCVEICEHDAISFNKKDRLEQNAHHCTLCLHCMTVCPTEAITIGSEGWPQFQKGLAAAAKAVLSRFDRKRVLHINVALSITPICDCWGFSTAPFRPDIGLFVSDDIVAVDKAAIDAIDCKEPFPGTIPSEMTVKPGSEHILFRMWGKDPYLQVKAAAAMRMGSLKYALKTIP